MNYIKNKDLHKIKNNNDKTNMIFLISLLLFIILSFISIVVDYIIFIKLNGNYILLKQYNFYKKLQNIITFVVCISAFINGIILLFVIFKNAKAEDCEKYRNYVFVFKEDIKKYKEANNEKLKNYKKEIKNLKHEINELKK